MSARRLESAVRGPQLKRSAPVFAALGDRTRLHLVSRLCRDGPMSIARLTAGSGVTRQAITKHLHVLSGAGLVRSSRRGRERVWAFDPKRIDEARHTLAAISRQWDQVLDRLRTLVED
jgi:DNA-binding transcriptional ArsR family regulator